MKVESYPVYWDITKIKEIKSKKEAVEEFEVYLFETFLKEAFNTNLNGLFEKGFSSKVYRDMFVQEIAEILGKNDPLKIAEAFEKAINRYTSVRDGE